MPVLALSRPWSPVRNHRGRETTLGRGGYPGPVTQARTGRSLTGGILPAAGRPAVTARTPSVSSGAGRCTQGGLPRPCTPPVHLPRVHHRYTTRLLLHTGDVQARSCTPVTSRPAPGPTVTFLTRSWTNSDVPDPLLGSQARNSDKVVIPGLPNSDKGGDSWVILDPITSGVPSPVCSLITLRTGQKRVRFPSPSELFWTRG